MKLALFNDYIPGAVLGDRIVDLREPLRPLGANSPQDLMEKLIANWTDCKGRLEKHVAISDGGIPLSQVKLRPPVPRPSKIICAAANYMEGIEGNVSELDFFHKSPSAIIGDGDTMVLPAAKATIFHHELELGVVIGKTVKNASPVDAMKNVFGYTIFQDASARGIFLNGQMSFFYSKNYDTFAPIGPMLVTADEVEEPHQLQVRLWCNGELRQDYSTDDMAHRIPILIAKASELNTLVPGDIIATGCNRQGLGPMQDGDTLVQEIEKLGRLTTHVIDPLKRLWPHGIDAEFADWVRKPSAQRGKMGPPRIVPASSRGIG